jgi:hypothetical protein
VGPRARARRVPALHSNERPYFFSFADSDWFWYYTRISKIVKKINKDNRPLIVAVFLVIAGLLSGASVFKNQTGIARAVSGGQKDEFFISIAQGAENTAMLFGARSLSPIAAVSGDGATSSGKVFFTALGAVKDVGAAIQTSSLSR